MNGLKQIVIFFIVQLFFIENSCAQINLVKNPSFEDTISCPTSFGTFNPYVQNWFNPSSSTSATPDYYNSCATVSSNCSVPNNISFQNAKDGNAYAGFFTYQSTADAREYVAGELTDSLAKGKKYCAQFYVSLMNQSQNAINNIGMYFSNAPISSSTFLNLPYSPQILNSPPVFLSDTAGWMLVSNTFIANGGEKYITIGNFSTDSNTDTIRVLNFGGNISYYYVDAVS
ncbi:MAG: hypothetical protein H0X46_08150, partial [Bacteroidetes bacterium]|nr:hypothetical protein [Bacteroidota bacterium]